MSTGPVLPAASPYRSPGAPEVESASPGDGPEVDNANAAGPSPVAVAAASAKASSGATTPVRSTGIPASTPASRQSSGPTLAPTLVPTLVPTPAPTPVPTTNVVPSVSLASPGNGAATLNRTLSWTYVANGGAAQTQYNVQIATNSGFGTIISAGPSSGTGASMQIPASVGLIYGNTFYWRAQVFNGNNWSGWSATWSFVFNGGPNATVVSPVSGVATTSRTLTWTYHSNGGPAQTGYRVELCSNSGFGTSLVDSVFTWDPNSSYLIPASTALTHGAVYYWHVAVSDGFAGSPWSPSGSFTWNG